MRCAARVKNLSKKKDASCRLNCQFVAALAGLPLNLQSQGAVHKLDLSSKMPVRDTAGPVGLFWAYEAFTEGIHVGHIFPLETCLCDCYGRYASREATTVTYVP